MNCEKCTVASVILLVGLFNANAFAQSPESEKANATPNEGTSASVAAPPGNASEEPAKALAKPTEASSAAAVVAPSKATLLFKRESSVIGIANDAKVFIDGKQVCAVPNGKDCKVDAETGKHLVKIDAALSAGEFSKTFEFKPGKTYTFAVSARTGSVLSGFGGLFGMIADNAINKDEAGKDNGVFTAKLMGEQ